ncbi:glutathione synthase/RimK-type ligase-like ATP-grasp enzyme [Fontibacillus phaseoli]|uniref:Glutathione synthase/RimK-type ligase-like ATP-grasp enzyme n=1 Tax=Fontibacillus phaseoli TaxID=1416533 RepID=A0A369BDW9_9BACL|nr:YheC/YheD family protein [Fontibacillus phaseoli]RCX19760.1 glutathione synthase/RimK-type ligase-like ATP-grasp enzyme [Fontibacillus phaseoli]
MGQNHVGILLNSSMYRGIPRRKTGQESLANYEEAARRYGLTPCFLRLGDMDLKQNKCIVYIYDGRDYVKTLLPIPSVIHNRALYTDPAARKKIQALSLQGKKIFNVNNRYGKDYVHDLLWGDPTLRVYLPETASASWASLQEMMVRHQDLILKPVRGSVGQGIMRLVLRENYWEIQFPTSKRKEAGSAVRLRKEEPPPWLRRLLQRVPYLLQERIPLAEFNHRPIDLRVTVQRGLDGRWGVTGLFAKAAPPGSFISNVAKGGGAYPAPELLAEALPPHLVPVILSHVEALALAIARRLSSCLPLLGDLGLDIGLTPNGHPYFIECNGRDQRYGFRKAEMNETWKETYRQPMAFARYLLEQSSSFHPGKF